MWAVLSDPSRRGRRWNLDEFFETGRREISLLMFQLGSLGLSPRRDRAVDFGCGVGRLTQALAAEFRHVIGIDVAPTMIQLAERLNKFGSGVTYSVNQRPDLSFIPGGTVDFVYSDIVLQHLLPDLAAGYVSEFLRIVRPGGVVVFQLPSHRRSVEEMPAAPVPLSSEAYSAQIELTSAIESKCAPSTAMRLVVTVRNTGPCQWSVPAGAIRAGNHWRAAADNAMLVQDDGRSSVPPLQPGEHCSVTLDIRAPDRAGSYVCEIDLVHEGLWWFADQGSPPLRIPFFVAEAASEVSADTPRHGAVSYGSAAAIYDTPSPLENAPTEFPMHGIERQAVEGLIARHGGVLRHVEIDERCGREWVGYRYFIRKAPRPRGLLARILGR
jgi:hypothetical protein